MPRKRILGVSPTSVGAGLSAFLLGISGVAYAMFTDQVDVTTNISTGTLRVQWVAGEPGGELVEIQSSSSARVATGFSAQLDQDGKNLTVSLTNVQPGDSIDFEALLQNRGSLPTKFGGFDVSQVPAAITVTPVDNPDYSDEAEAPGGKWEHGTPVAGMILQPLDHADAEFVITVQDGAVQDTSYGFTIPMAWVEV